MLVAVVVIVVVVVVVAVVVIVVVVVVVVVVDNSTHSAGVNPERVLSGGGEHRTPRACTLRTKHTHTDAPHGVSTHV